MKKYISTSLAILAMLITLTACKKEASVCPIPEPTPQTGFAELTFYHKDGITPLVNDQVLVAPFGSTATIFHNFNSLIINRFTNADGKITIELIAGNYIHSVFGVANGHGYFQIVAGRTMQKKITTNYFVE